MTTDDASYPADEWPKELPADLSMAARTEDTDLGTPLHEASSSGEGRINETTKRPPMVVGEGTTEATVSYVQILERDNAALRVQLEAAEKAVSENAYDRDEWIRRCGDADGKVKALRELVREVMPFVREHGSWVIDETWMRRADALSEKETT